MKKLTKGSALIFSLIILTFLLAIAISVAQNAVTEEKSASTTGKSLQAFQVADNGSELFLKAIKEANSDDSLLEVLGSGCGDDYYEGNIVGGNYKIAFYNSEGDQINCSAPLSEVDRIKSVGTFGSTTRAVDVAVAASGSGNVTGSYEIYTEPLSPSTKYCRHASGGASCSASYPSTGSGSCPSNSTATHVMSADDTTQAGELVGGTEYQVDLFLCLRD